MERITYKLAIITLMLAVALVLTVAGSFGNRTRQCLDDPEPGDIYLARMSALAKEERSTEYGLMRVEEVYSDRIVAHPSIDRSPNKRRAYRHLEQAVGAGVRFDLSRQIEIARDDLPGLHERGVIVVAKNPDA